MVAKTKTANAPQTRTVSDERVSPHGTRAPKAVKAPNPYAVTPEMWGAFDAKLDEAHRQADELLARMNLRHT